MRTFLLLSVMFRAVMVIDYGNTNVPNDCEKHFLSCPISLERTDDCEYFLDNRCKYLHKRVDRLKYPVLYRRDHYEFTRREGDLPYYKCLVLEHLKISWKRELKYEGNQKTKWITMIPSTAFPLDILKSTFIQVDKTLPEKALWKTENMSDFNEFVYEFDDDIVCADDNEHFRIKDIDGRHLAQEEFDLGSDRRKYYDLRMITIVVMKENQQACARIHPKYSNHNQQSNVVTYVVGSERAYPTYDRIEHMTSSAPPWARGDAELWGRDSAWCRGRRLVLALSEATILNKDGEATALSGPHYCSLYLWEDERVARLTFAHNERRYVVKVVLQLREDTRSWTPISIELDEKLEQGHERLGDAVRFELDDQKQFTRNETFYSLEPELLMGNDELKLRINRLGVQFDPKETPYNFSVPFHSKRSTSSTKSRCRSSSSLYPGGGFGAGHQGDKPGRNRTEAEKRQDRYEAVGKRAKFVLLPFLLAVFLLAVIVTVLRFAHRLRNWLYDKLIARMLGKRRGEPGAPLTALQRLALAAQYARAQAANLAVYAAEGVAVVAALRALCRMRDMLLAAGAPAPACRR